MEIGLLERIDRIAEEFEEIVTLVLNAVMQRSEVCAPLLFVRIVVPLEEFVNVARVRRLGRLHQLGHFIIKMWTRLFYLNYQKATQSYISGGVQRNPRLGPKYQKMLSKLLRDHKLPDLSQKAKQNTEHLIPRPSKLDLNFNRRL